MTVQAGTTVRSIDPGEIETWGRLGGDDIVHTARSMADAGTSGPDRWLVAERDGQAVGRLGVVVEDAGCGLGLAEHILFGIWLGDGALDAVRDTSAALARAAVATLPPGRQTIDLWSNPERHRDIEARRALLASVGGRLFQEKVGFQWEDDGRELPQDGRLRFDDLGSVGPTAYGALMGRCQAGTLDRNDRYYLGLCGSDAWGRQMVEYLVPGHEASWLLARDREGRDVGFVAVGPSDDQGTGTIVHIGVLPEARGRGYAIDLLAAANRAARERGYARMLSDVDTENAPMRAAMARAGHHPDRRAWHVWHDRLTVVVLADGTPVTLRPVDDRNRDALAGLAVRPDQTQFVATVTKSYADAAAQPNSNPTMWGIYAGDEPVGFAMIEDGAEPTADEPHPWRYTLWRLLIDAHHQRRGYGRAALDLVIDYLGTRPDATELITSAVPGDGSPLPFYERYGFEQTGEVYEGEVVLRLAPVRRPHEEAP
jgi:diamine N-acetyltransferase